MPTLMTERLMLRPMCVSDADDMYEYACWPEVTRYLLWSPHSSKAYTLDYLQYIESRYAVGDFYDWAIVLRSENKMIGTCGFTKFGFENNMGEIGYVINPKYQGMGIAPEAAREVMRFGFEVLNLHRIEARFMQGNTHSEKVMQKLGMTFEGFLKDSVYVKDSYRTVGVCAILYPDFIKAREN